jgi:hypothetical protein
MGRNYAVIRLPASGDLYHSIKKAAGKFPAAFCFNRKSAIANRKYQ